MHQNDIFVKNARQVLKVERSESSTLQKSKNTIGHPNLTFLHPHIALNRDLLFVLYPTRDIPLLLSGVRFCTE